MCETWEHLSELVINTSSSHHVGHSMFWESARLFDVISHVGNPTWWFPPTRATLTGCWGECLMSALIWEQLHRKANGSCLSNCSWRTKSLDCRKVDLHCDYIITGWAIFLFKWQEVDLCPAWRGGNLTCFWLVPADVLKSHACICANTCDLKCGYRKANRSCFLESQVTSRIGSYHPHFWRFSSQNAAESMEVLHNIKNQPSYHVLYYWLTL